MNPLKGVICTNLFCCPVFISQSKEKRKPWIYALLSLLSLTNPLPHFLSPLPFPVINYLSIQTLCNYCDPTFPTADTLSESHHHRFPAKTISHSYILGFPIPLKLTILSSKTFHILPISSPICRRIQILCKSGKLIPLSKDAVAQTIVVQKDSPRGVHFRRAGPREKVYFKAEEVRACIVTCGGLCPGINTVIREIVCGLNNMYGVQDVLGIEEGYKGFYSKNTMKLTPKVVNDIHKLGGTFLRTSRGGHDTNKIVDNIEDRGINQVYIIGGDGTQKGASLIYEVIDKSFGFDTAVEEAQRAINAAHVEVNSVENGIGIVKLMGRYSGFIAMYATLASRDVDCCLIPESSFYLEGRGGLFEFIEQRLKENGHLVIVVAEGAGQEFVAAEVHTVGEKDASGNKLLRDVGPWLSNKIKDHFTQFPKMAVNMKYIDPTYMIRAIPSNASDNIYCTLLAHSAVHGAMAGYSGFTVGPVNSRHAYLPIARVTERPNTVEVKGRMWARLLESTNQPSFVTPPDQQRVDKEMIKDTNKINITST
ncbi:ATP-dependent 6-phosphofructokinase 6 isoform X3 [Lathyrus oleraceus]|uniref:ATP-dependent 6-phosphofructokinase 6 isoform X3 n=1 Tax=Pisum sativum TaxID=3888 RepID=UPI0021D147EF|nr:ATP-dependent 6-phosphofructokinase 6-like isoform X3 [Pisum sativum]